jgi:hypothetical protein
LKATSATKAWPLLPQAKILIGVIIKISRKASEIRDLFIRLNFWQIYVG